MRYSQDFIEKVRDASNILDVVSQHTTLKKTGSGYTGLCPFPGHKEKTPSFHVSDVKQAYHCFGCGKGGDIYRFMMELRGLSFLEALEYLAQQASIPLPKEENVSPQKSDDKKRQEQFFKINRLAMSYYHQNFLELDPQHAVREYAAKRGLTSEIIDKFMIGFATDSWDGLTRKFKSVKAPLVLAETAGLIKKRPQDKNPDSYYDLFRDRLIFPILSPMGQTLGFGGRILGEGQPKYLNSPESPIFSKGKTFYGLHETAKFLRSEDLVVVVEGYMDFLALYRAGIQNVVATLGTALTSYHAKIIKRYTKNVALLFDGDAAGQKATERSLQVLLAEGLFVKSVDLPDNLDPDDFIEKHGVDTLKTLIKEAGDLFFKTYEKMTREKGSQPSAKVTIIEELSSVLNAMTDLRLKELYLMELAQRLDVKPEWLRRSLEINKSQAYRNPKEAKSGMQVGQRAISQNAGSLAPKASAKTVPPREELFLLNLALSSEELMKTVIEAEVSDSLLSPLLQKALKRAIELYRQSPKSFVRLTAILSNEFENPSFLTLHLSEVGLNLSANFSNSNLREGQKGTNKEQAAIQNEQQLEEQKTKLLKDCIQKIKTKEIKRKANILVNELKTQKDPKKLEQFVNVIKHKQSIKSD